MAKKNKEEPGTDLETVQPSSIDNPMEDFSPEEMQELSDNTGLEDYPEEKRRIPLIAWNLEFKDDKGHNLRPDMFTNCQTNEQMELINAALIYMKQSFSRVYRDPNTNVKTLMCSSYDLKTGEPTPTDQDPNPQPISCDTCKYRRGKKGEKKACTTVDRVLAWDLDRKFSFIFNAIHSSFVPFDNYLTRNFFSKLIHPKNPHKRMDIPLYAMHTQMTLKDEESPQGKTYYVPTFESLGVLPKEVVMDLVPVAKAAKNISRKEFVVEAPDKNTVGKKGEVLEGEVMGEPEDVPF
jgi:hypothetical protein